jgi:hypothetical protein
MAEAVADQPAKVVSEAHGVDTFRKNQFPIAELATRIARTNPFIDPPQKMFESMLLATPLPN